MTNLWKKWLYYDFDMLLRHVGTAGLTWLGLGLKEGGIDWHNLWVAILSGAILPSLFTIFQRGLPKQNGDSQLDDSK